MAFIKVIKIFLWQTFSVYDKLLTCGGFQRQYPILPTTRILFKNTFFIIGALSLYGNDMKKNILLLYFTALQWLLHKLHNRLLIANTTQYNLWFKDISNHFVQLIVTHSFQISQIVFQSHRHPNELKLQFPMFPANTSYSRNYWEFWELQS